MDKNEIISRIEVIIDYPTTCKEDKVALKEACNKLSTAISREDIIKAIELLAAILGIGAFILTISS